MKNIPLRILLQCVLLATVCIPGGIVWLMLQFQPLDAWLHYPYCIFAFPIAVLQLCFAAMFLFSSVWCWHPRSNLER